MIRITELKLPVGESTDSLRKMVLTRLRIRPEELLELSILRRSLDARRGHAFIYSYTVEAVVRNESAVWSRLKPGRDLERRDPAPDPFGTIAVQRMRPEAAERPVVVGFGPAGIFAALALARAGLCPIVLERGRPVEERTQDVKRFWTLRQLDPESNVQFGEGGAGTFSDGKLNTLVKDRDGFNRAILNEFVRAGAPEEILYEAKPHIGTDKLRGVVRALREEILQLGGEIRFRTCLERIERTESGLRLLLSRADGSAEKLDCPALFLGIGHSARDTYANLRDCGIRLEPKPFAVGLRIEHPQRWVNERQYREHAGDPRLAAASYKVTWQDPESGRGVYSFCMCPGGIVAAAASEPGRLVTNGMSNYARDEQNANAGLILTVKPEDYEPYAAGPGDELAGVAFQRQLEETAFRMGGGDWRAPVQYVGDYLKDCGLEAPAGGFSDMVQPSFPCGVREARLAELFPEGWGRIIGRGLVGIDHSMQGFASPGAVLTGVESRSSSPVRIPRDENMQASMAGVYPIGEGAGYAGGIMSAAMDGLRAALMYLRQFESNEGFTGQAGSK